ncbi:MAG: phosphoribosylformimino-5-aminoimidazole carboxamide ribotide isomerase [Lachnospiraceae bacterium]|nr:phosphoribosylformimino-5-aminoimidazole carboxamide ribotide isomerase [Lachnospiraceae bacterium]
MEFRPCIDIHNGKVKQIVGGSLRDEGDSAAENFVAESSAAFYASLYRERGLKGGHVILLNPASSPFYEATKAEALRALSAFPGGLMLGGGVNDENAAEFLEAGASHVIVTSFVFRDGRIHMDRLERLVRGVGKERLVLDLSCRRRDGKYFVVTNRWQSFTGEELCPALFSRLGECCSEFLVHASDVEGQRLGVDTEVLKILSESEGVITYAGGIRSMEDIELIRRFGEGRINFTVGSALSIFGGDLSMEEIIREYGE